MVSRDLKCKCIVFINTCTLCKHAMLNIQFKQLLLWLENMHGLSTAILGTRRIATNCQFIDNKSITINSVPTPTDQSIYYLQSKCISSLLLKKRNYKKVFTLLEND